MLAVHSLSKRSNLAGARAGFYAGDAELVHYLSELRKHAGFMVPGPVQAAAVAAWGDDDHVEAQRARYRARLERFAACWAPSVSRRPFPEGGSTCGSRRRDGDAWALVRRLATEGGALVSPGEFYGPRAPGSCGSRWCSPTTASSWWPVAWLAARPATDGGLTEIPVSGGAIRP